MTFFNDVKIELSIFFFNFIIFISIAVSIYFSISTYFSSYGQSYVLQHNIYVNTLHYRCGNRNIRKQDKKFTDC